MHKHLFTAALVLLAGCDLALAQINTTMYREMARKHERMLEGTEAIPGTLTFADTVWDDLTVSALNQFKASIKRFR